MGDILQGHGWEISRQTEKLSGEHDYVIFDEDYIGRFKIQENAAKSKALRKELKTKNSKKE